MNTQNTSYTPTNSNALVPPGDADEDDATGQAKRKPERGGALAGSCRTGRSVARVHAAHPLRLSCPVNMDEATARQCTKLRMGRAPEVEIGAASPKLSRDVKFSLMKRCDHLPVDGQLRVSGLHASPNSLSFKGMTALQVCVQAGTPDDVESVLGIGGNADTPSADGETALTLAARMQDATIVERLCRISSDIDRGDPGGRTALMHAAASGKLGNLRVLLDSGSAVDRQDHAGRTALLHAVDAVAPGVAREQYGCVVHELIDAGADVNHADRDGWTALMLAAKHGNIELARCLLDAGADPGYALSADGGTALSFAIEGNHARLVRLLVGEAGVFAVRVGAGPVEAYDLAVASGGMAAVDVLVGSGLALSQEEQAGLISRHSALKDHLLDRIGLASASTLPLIVKRFSSGDMRMVNQLQEWRPDTRNDMHLSKASPLRAREGKGLALNMAEWRKLCPTSRSISETDVTWQLLGEGLQGEVVDSLLLAIRQVEPAWKRLCELLDCDRLRIRSGRAELEGATWESLKEELFNFAVASCEPFVQLAYPPAGMPVESTTAMRQARALYDALNRHCDTAARPYRGFGLERGGSLLFLETDIPELLQHWLCTRCAWPEIRDGSAKVTRRAPRSGIGA